MVISTNRWVVPAFLGYGHPFQAESVNLGGDGGKKRKKEF